MKGNLLSSTGCCDAPELSFSEWASVSWPQAAKMDGTGNKRRWDDVEKNPQLMCSFIYLFIFAFTHAVNLQQLDMWLSRVLTTALGDWKTSSRITWTRVPMDTIWRLRKNARGSLMPEDRVWMRKPTTSADASRPKQRKLTSQQKVKGLVPHLTPPPLPRTPPPTSPTNVFKVKRNPPGFNRKRPRWWSPGKMRWKLGKR